MAAKMFIPITVTLTEHEYVIVNNLMKDLGMENNQVSEAIRKIIREWHEWNSQGHKSGITPRERKAPARSG